MERIKGNKEIIILLLIVLWLYVLITLGGCSKDPINERYLLNNNLDVALICEDFKNEPFLELGKKGIEDASKELGVRGKVVLLNLKETDKTINSTMNKTVCNNNLVIILGGWLKNAVKVSSRQLRARNFVVIDEVVNEPNVKSITYRSEEGAFLMGVIAGGETKENKVGFVGGLNDEEGMSFLSGYVSGVKISNKRAYDNLVDYTNVRYVDGFKDVDKAYIKAKELYEDGCDIIFHSCGSAGVGVFKAAKETGKKALGVDINSSEFYREYKDVILSSMIKRIDKSVIDVCTEIKEGNFKSGIKNLKDIGISEGYIDYSEDTKGNVSEKTFIYLNKLKKLIKEGEIKIPDKLFQVVEFNING
ncbi:MAG: BMP family lipoprotein [Clostridium sp.]